MTDTADRPITQPKTFETVAALRNAGDTTGAFNALLAVAGGESDALRMAADDPSLAGPVSDRLSSGRIDRLVQSRIDLLRGDAQLRGGDRSAALSSLRKAAESLAGSDTYLVDADPPSEELRGPFNGGCGSLGDNALIKRFVSLGSDADLSTEFERVWQIYERQPPTTRPEVDDPRPDENQRRQFVFDYAYFLKTRGLADRSLSLILDQILRTDLDMSDGWTWNYGGQPAPVDWRMSTDDFFRLGYGEFQNADRGDEFVSAIQKQIDSGRNAARRSMARFLLLQLRPVESLAMEMEYIRDGHFNAISAECRRAWLEEAYRKPADAIADYENALRLPWEPLSLPAECRLLSIDQGEVLTPGGKPAEWNEHGQIVSAEMSARALRMSVLERLIPLYEQSDQKEKVLDATLSELDLTDLAGGRADLKLDAAIVRFSNAGQLKRMTDWIRARAATDQKPRARARLFWSIGEFDAAADSVVAIAKSPRGNDRPDYDLQRWKLRFERAGRGPMLDTKLVAAIPGDLDARIPLLAADPTATDGQWILVLDQVFRRIKDCPADGRVGLRCLPDGDDRAPFFRSRCDVAYRLMRCYERTGQIDKLEAVAIEVLKPGGPFKTNPIILTYDTADPDDAEAAITLAIQHADTPARQAALTAVLKDSPWRGQIEQIHRRLQKVWPSAAAAPAAWGNVPADITVLASGDNALSITSDASRIVVGNLWGLSVYSLDGKPVTRVAIGEPVKAVASTGDAIWAGCQNGLYCVDPRDWSVKLVRNLGNPDAIDIRIVNKNVWVITDIGSLRVDLATNRVMETRLDVMLGDRTERVPNGPVIVDNGSIYIPGSRFNPDTNQWQPMNAAPVAMVDGQLWGVQFVHRKDETNFDSRLCLIDRTTLRTTIVPVVGSQGHSYSQSAGGMELVGALQGRPVFTPDHELFLEFDGKRLRPYRCPDDAKTPEPPGMTPVDGLSDWSPLSNRETRLPGGWVAVTYRDLQSIGASANNYQWLADSGMDRGVTIENQAGGKRVISDGPFGNDIGGDSAKAIAVDGPRVWLATDRGISLLDQQGRVLENFNVGNGLPMGVVKAAIPLDGKIYFALSHGNAGGGLAVFDPQTRVFSLRVQSDGLGCDAVRDFSVGDGLLRIDYGYEYMQRGHDYGTLHYRPTWFNPKTEAFVEPGKPARFADRPVDPASRRGPMPYLGGLVFSEQTIGRRTWLLGERGVVIFDAGKTVNPPELAFFPVKREPDQDERLHADADAVDQFVPLPVDRLRQLAGDPNPYKARRAVEACYEKLRAGDEPSTAAVVGFVAYPDLEVRKSVVIGLILSEAKSSLPGLQRALTDENRSVRFMAACGVAHRSVRVPAEVLSDLFEHRNELDDSLLPSNAELGFDQLKIDSAGMADASTIVPFLQYEAFSPTNDQDRVYPLLVKAIARDPKVLEAVLAAHQKGNFASTQQNVADLCAGVGKPCLPALHAALSSPDRVVRSNAARACGRILDPTSLPYLDKAWDLESGLSRASIVWAWGQFKNRDEVPKLLRIYTQLGPEAAGYSADGLLASQNSGVRLDRQFQSARTGDPVTETNEHLLTREDVCIAIASIGPRYAPGFFKAVAAGDDRDSQIQLTTWLSQLSDPADIKEAIEALKVLQEDLYRQVRTPATVFLAGYGEPAAKEQVLKWIAKPIEPPAGEALECLNRLTSEQAEFAKAAVKDCLKNPALDHPTRAACERTIQRFGW